MVDLAQLPLEGHCTCGVVRYRLDAMPLVVHACHCRWCQRETGSAFALNAMVETDRVAVLQGAPEAVPVPSASGKGQRIMRCPQCRVALWSHYPGGGEAIAFVRVGTLDTPDALPPDVHIYTASKLPWLVLPANARAFAEFYDLRVEWSAEALQRYRDAKARFTPSA
ncbi:aldehyde-activating protein [Lysobacter daejeonensis GH1-9]|uniref:Aldehyde-activating protein n=2 Tax=Aerolutibacter TaxID=3382701 RepID=A0A0A0ES18_9GAMM|nr:aldehyde-activating protein [Lysobacter daejeonensis GH1-9]